MVSGRLPTEENPGTLTFVKTQLESLRRIGVDVQYHAIVGAHKVKFAQAIPRINRLLHEGHFDVVHAHHGFCGMSSRFQWRVPLVVSFLGDELLLDVGPGGKVKPAAPFWYRVNRMLARTCAAVIVKSDEMAGRLRGIRNVHVIPNGVDFDQFRPIDKAEARRKLGLDPHRRYVLFPAAANRPDKDFPTARAAVDALRAEHAAEVKILTFENTPHSRVPLLMNAADVVLLTSFFEGSPNVIKEAMACGRPIVSTNVGDVQALVGRTAGCFVTTRDPKEISRRLEDALAFAQAQTSGRADIAHLELSTVAQRVLGVYEVALGRAIRQPRERGST
jgi:glycosyltransferase involved in cell wall biosynthesis